MDATPEDWLLDFNLIEGIPVPGGDLPSLLEPGFHWSSNSFSNSTDTSKEFVGSFGKSVGIEGQGSRKRLNSGSCCGTDSKACREKKRRDRLNDRFQELNAILEPGRSSSKMDKTVILSDAMRMVTQLRDEAQKLKDSCEELQGKINDLKAEKNELREEKQKLKADKERLEQQLKVYSTPPAFMPPPPSSIPHHFPAPGQFVGSKLMPFIGYPGVPMWQFTPPASVDTSQDHVLRPPVA